MTLLALLIKEMRLRMRGERMVWILVVYVLLLGLLGWFSLNGTYNAFGSSINVWSNAGTSLYQLLTTVQLLLILFITPAFTSSAVNGEKERQTYDMLLCSRLSSFSLASGKLIAGLSNALLLIAAAIPLFSLVFFFGGVSPTRVLTDLLMFVSTAVLVATFGLLCSTLFSRPSVSTAVCYMVVLLWLVVPLLIMYIAPTMFYTSAQTIRTSQGVIVVHNGVTTSYGYPNPGGPIISGKAGGINSNQPPPPPFFLAWNPVYILSTASNVGITVGNYTLRSLIIPPWLLHILLDIGATIIFFLLSLWTVKPNALVRIHTRRRQTARGVWQKKETRSGVKA